MTPSEPNHARDRLNGRSGDRFDLGYAPGPADWRRWLLAEAERVVGAEAARLEPPPDEPPEEPPEP